MTLEQTAEAFYRKFPETLCDRSNSDDAREAYRRFMQVRELLGKEEDETGLKLIIELADKAANYVDSIVRQRCRPNNGYGINESIDELVAGDQRRRIAHEALIAQLHATNRYLFQTYGIGGNIPAGGVFSLPPEAVRDRNTVGDWAGHLVLGLYDHRNRIYKGTTPE